MILWIDFETRSRCDLKKHGVYNYAQDGTTEVLCMSYAFDDEDVQTWTSGAIPERILNHTGEIRAHNAAFERLIFWYVLQIDFKLEQFYCTAAQARANCAPGSLEDVGRFAGASMKKDHRGSQLIRLLSIPRADGTFNESLDLMSEMVAYCEQDVRAMRAISKSLRPLSKSELDDYHVNERINDRGVLVDVPLACASIAYADRELEDIQSIVRDVTNGQITSVRSPKMREWVKERLGEEALKLMWTGEKYSIDKTVRANLLAINDPEQVPPDVAEVIQCADDLWASSVAKFSRLKDLADAEDHRVRGAFVFSGGAATGRASSYGAQVHNFTRKCAADPDAVRHAMVRGHAIAPKFGTRITDVLKSMLRPALMAAPGNVLIAADWSSIEARMNPWLSNCTSGMAKLNLFAKGEDVYKVNAAATFAVRVQDVNKDQRQIGKVQELACFTAETKVLTHNGVKAIVDVKLSDKLWDGAKWVSHQGVIYKGVRKVINVCGIEVTPDHLIKTQTTWKQAHQLVSNKQLMTQALAHGSANLPCLDANVLNKVRHGYGMRAFNAIATQPPIWYTCIIYLKARLLDAMLVQKKPQDFGAKTILNTPKLVQTTTTADDCLTGYRLVKTDAITQKIEVTQITVGGALNCTSRGEKTNPHFYVMWYSLKDGISRTWNWIELMLTKAMNLATCDSLQSKKIAITNDPSKKCNNTSNNLKPVYDILNSGKRNRFTVITDEGALIVHNCGFAGGIGAFAAMGRAYGIHLPESDARRMVDAWRRANPWAVSYWSDLESAYTRAMRNKGYEFSAGRVTYLFDGLHLWYALPSGRVLCYPFAKIEEEGVTYAKAAWKPAADAREWPRARLWKGLACENITQAAANDVLRSSLLQLDNVVLHVHDEIVVECAESDAAATQSELERIMCTPPAWCADLPLGVEASIMRRYGK
tara:strand:+ start:445 stop:3240 length:2796 start_codon:yes stop_codon:yes gene_type:complete